MSTFAPTRLRQLSGLSGPRSTEPASLLGMTAPQPVEGANTFTAKGLAQLLSLRQRMSGLP